MWDIRIKIAIPVINIESKYSLGVLATWKRCTHSDVTQKKISKNIHFCRLLNGRKFDSKPRNANFIWIVWKIFIVVFKIWIKWTIQFCFACLKVENNQWLCELLTCCPVSNEMYNYSLGLTNEFFCLRFPSTVDRVFGNLKVQAMGG